MTLLAWFLGIVTGTVATLLLLNFRAVSEPEPEDGVQPADPWTQRCPERGCRLLRWHGGPHAMAEWT
jgi:hypothetical protein